MSTHAMIDIETLGTMSNSVILSVGAVKFDPFKSDDPHDGRHWKLDVDAQTSSISPSQKRQGRKGWP